MLLILYLFALFLLVLLGFYVFVANPRSRIHQTFAVFIAFLALWTIKDIILWGFHEPNESVGWWAAASFIVSLLLQYALVIFANFFPEDRNLPRGRIAVIFSPGLILITAALAGLLWKEVGFSNDRFYITLSPLAYAFVIYLYGVFSYGVYLLAKKYARFRGTQQGQQIGAIIWAVVITGVLKTVANIILPYFNEFSLLPYSAIFVLPGVLIYAYAISNFKLFSLQTALNQFELFPITYKIALSIATVAIASFTLLQIPIVWASFQEGYNFEAWRKYLVFSIIAALLPNLFLVLLVVRIISRPLQRITLAAVQVTNGAYGTEVDMRRSNDEIGLLADSFNEMSRKMAEDIRQLRILNEQLIKTEKLVALGTLSAGIAHEVNNPLASISSLVQIINSKQPQDEETKEMLRLISTQINRISRVTKDMSDFARMQPSAKTIVNFNEVIEKSLRLALFDKTFQKLEIVRDFDPNLPVILADDDQFQQVFLNFLLNARDAMPSGGTLTIQTSNEAETIRIAFRDTGSGVEESIRQNLFDPFFTTKKTGRGTGLGLSICFSIVNGHGGSIEVSSNSPHGAAFIITLPKDKSDL